MKRYAISIAVVVFFFSLVGAGCGSRRGAVRTRPMPPSQRAVMDVSIFYDSLSPYGMWYSVDGYGWVWTPYDVQAGWRPYSHGHWAFTDYGWTWVSAWRWGWAPFHYGRWVRHQRHGWFWVPDRIWGPAWVVWRRSPGWIGWAPMPPHRGWRTGMEFEVADEPNLPIEPYHYSFVEDRDFTSRSLDRVLALPARNGTLLQGTRVLTNYVRTEDRVVNRSLEVEPIEQAIGRPVPRQRVVDAASSSGGEQVSGNEVRVYRPSISRSMPERAPQATAPQRQPARSAEEASRREENERRQLETEQAREKKRLEDLHRQEASRAAAADEVRRRQENERRAQEEQRQRERDLLKSRQETRRQVEPPAAPKAPQRKPAEEKKPMPQRKPPENNE